MNRRGSATSVIILIAIAIIFAVVAGYILIKSTFQVPPPVVHSTTTPSVQIAQPPLINSSTSGRIIATDFAPITIRDANPSSSWITYQSAPFSFEYPPQFELTGPENNFLYYCDGAEVLGREGKYCTGAEFRIQINIFNKKLDIQEFEKYYTEPPNKIEKITVNTTSTSKTFYIGPNQEGGMGIQNPNVWLALGDFGNFSIELHFGGGGYFFDQKNSDTAAMVVGQTELDKILPILSTVRISP